MSRQLRPWQIDILNNLISGSVVDNKGRRTVGASPSINQTDYVTKSELANVLGGGLSGAGSTNSIAMWSGLSSLTTTPFYYNAAQFSIKPNFDLSYRLGESSFNFLELYTASIIKDTSGALALTIATVQAHPILFTTGNTIRWRVADDGHIWPNLADTYDLGTSVNRVNILHSRHINIETSDIHGVSYFWPVIQGGVGTFLQNDGAGNLTWTVPAGGLSGSGTGSFIAMWSSASVLTNAPLEYNSGTSSLRPSFDFGVNLGEASRHFLSVYTATVIKDSSSALSLAINVVQAHPITFGTTNTIRWLIEAGGTLRPNSNNAYDIGSTSLRPATVYAATGFVGPGSSITALNASELTSGTLPDARLSGTYSNNLTFSGTLTGGIWAGSVTISGITNTRVVWSSSGNLTGSGDFTWDNVGKVLTVNGTVAATTLTGAGSGITSISASNIASGSLNDARLSSNVPLKNAANTFTSAITMTSVNINFNAGFGIAASGTSVALASSNVECYTSSTLRAAFGTSVQLWFGGALRTIATFDDGAGHNVLYY